MRINKYLLNIHFISFFRIRGAGSAAINMCLVASGCVEAYYEIGIHCWDMAAGAVIVSEAGGVLLDVEGNESFFIISLHGNKVLHVIFVLWNFKSCIMYSRPV